VPTDVIIIKGAVASASDSATPLPEGGAVTNNIYTNQYFGLSYPFSSDWIEKFKGPPPSDSGGYVLAQLRRPDSFKGPSKGTILVTAQDLFFGYTPASNAMELIKYTKDTLTSDYKVERPPTEIKIANRSFVRFDYMSPVAELHWYVLATEIRCHAVQFVLTSRDSTLLESLIRDMDKMKLPDGAGATAGTGGGDSPVCIKDYASGENVISRVEPFLTDRKFNPIPVRIIIDKNGKVKHIHLISAFPEQARTITDALSQWQFKPYLRNGQPVEVETGVMFGNVPPPRRPPAKTATTVAN
jgi:hypothetical protein